MAPSWSGLPSELLGVVFLRLRCLADRVYFAAVCRSWRSAAQALAPPPAAEPQLPWLLLLPSAAAPCFLSPLAGPARRALSLPPGAQGARLCGSHAGGWLAVAADGWRSYALVNLFSRARLPLPDRIWLPRPDVLTCLVVRAVALSAPPTAPGCVAAALVCGVSNLAFLRPRTDRRWWLAPGITLHGLQDVLYHDGAMRGFHAVSSNGTVTVFVQEGAPDAADLRMASRHYRMQPRRIPYAAAASTRYLVESRGRLLMVVRPIPSSARNGSVAGPATAPGFEVLELAVQALPGGGHEASWVELDDGGLDGRVLFLARACSRAFEGSQVGGVPEGIYFLDDTRFDISLALSSGGNFPCSDIGWCSGAGVVKRGINGFPSDFRSCFSSPAWFYP
ncbi:hypothetical protein BS78_K156300 [Paspalum vaginatum]|uniref:DUF295 domain-containing protein n=1 Tax=Paspalum vaginatum TaxID=158149 RepID=A0A9W7X895_9POAL|nr:hypothetical protein BS78_K156300 [Paspalum vaginatum]